MAKQNQTAADIEAAEFVRNDGRTHINVDPTAKTGLGRKLDNLTRVPFMHPVLGEFHSLEAFWIFIRTTEIHDEIRYLYGGAAKAARKQYTTRRVEKFWDLVEEAIYYKIVQNPNLKRDFVESTLPFDNYHIQRSDQGNLLVRHRSSALFCGVLEKLRLVVREDRELKPWDLTDILNRPRA